MTQVKVCDLRAAGVCPDARNWFAKHNLDWKDFVRNGCDAQDLLNAEPDNPIVQRVVKAAETREAS